MGVFVGGDGGYEVTGGYDHVGEDDTVYEEDQEDEPTNESASISKLHLL